MTNNNNYYLGTFITKYENIAEWPNGIVWNKYEKTLIFTDAQYKAILMYSLNGISFYKNL